MWGIEPGGEDAFAQCDDELSWDDARAARQSFGGVSVGFDGWQTNQPDGVAGEDCGLLVHSRSWADVECSEVHVYTCQLPL